MVTDPIADMLTRIRNAISERHSFVQIPASNTKKAISEILLAEGYINNVKTIEEGIFSKIEIELKYGAKKEKVINGLKRISKPGLRVYASCEDLPRVLGGMGIAIISTPKGIMTDKSARAANLGGEVMAFVW